MRPHQGSVERKENLPHPAGHTLLDAPQDPIGFLGSQGTLPFLLILASEVTCGGSSLPWCFPSFFLSLPFLASACRAHDSARLCAGVCSQGLETPVSCVCRAVAETQSRCPCVCVYSVCNGRGKKNQDLEEMYLTQPSETVSAALNFPDASLFLSVPVCMICI